MTLGKILNSLSFGYVLNRGCGVYAVEGSGICKMRIVSLSSFIVLVSLGFIMGGILDLSPVSLAHS